MIQILAITSQEVSLIGWFIAAASTCITIYFARKAKPFEKLSYSLDTIELRNSFLEKRVSDLEAKEDVLRTKVDDLNTEAALNKEKAKFVSESLVKAEALIETQKAQLFDMQTQVINSQVAASLMRNQVTNIAKRFNIPETLTELKRGKGE